MHPRYRLLPVSLLLMLVALLGGCATTRPIGTDVQSFHAGPAPVANATYRFERLPSQAQVPAQSQWEAAAERILAEHGLQHNDEAAQYAVQVNAQMLQYVDPSDAAWGGGWIHRHGPFFGGFGGPLRLWYRHSVRVLLRDLHSNAVVYETAGSFDGPWSDSGNLIPVILQAALRDYPNASNGIQRITIELAPPPDAPAE
jgi:predicted small secreted protein